LDNGGERGVMLAKLKTFSLLGIEALPVEVEVDVSPGALPKTVLMGLPEAAVVENVEVIPVASLAQAVGFFAGTLDIEPTPSRLEELFESFSKYEDDFADVRGQEMAKRAITIAAAGAHNLLMLWPFGPFSADCVGVPCLGV